MEKLSNIQLLVRTAMLGAVTIVLAATPLGYIPLYYIIPFLPLTVTIMVVPVALGGLTLGWPSGMFLGLIFGVTSFLRAPLEPLGQILLQQSGFLTLVATVAPRLLVGLVAGCAHYLLVRNKELRKLWFYAATGLVASLANTILFLGVLWLAFDNSATGITLGVLGSIILAAGIPEAIVNAILVGVLGKAMLRTRKSKS